MARISAAALLILAMGIAVLPFHLHQTLPRGDDVAEHVQFVTDYAAGLAEGLWYPRWLRHPNRGYGGPVFIFYPPLATALVASLFRLGLPLFAAFRLGFLLLTALAAACGALLAHRLTRTLAGSAGAVGSPSWGAAMCGSLLVLLPYHSVDLFSRFALAEAATFVFLPLFFLFLEAPVWPRVPLGGLAFGGLCLAHLPTAYLTVLVSLVWVMCRSWRCLPVLLAALALGAGCSAIYWVPAVVERPLVHADWLENNPVYQFQEHFLFSPGRVDVTSDPMQGKTRTEVDLPTLRKVRKSVLFTLALAVAAWLFWRFLGPGGSPGRPSDDALLRYLLLALLSTLAMTRLAAPLWRFLPGMASVAFPWRLSIFVTLAAANLTGVSLARLAGSSIRFQSVVSALVLGGGLFLTLGIASGADWIRFTPSYARKPGVMLRVAGVFMPRSSPAMRGFRLRPAAPEGFLPGAAGRVPGALRCVLSENQRRVFDLEIPPGPPVPLHLGTFDYPGWQAFLDGHPVAHRRGPLGTMETLVPPGQHRVVWLFGSTPLRRWAARVSLMAVILAATLTLLSFKRTLGE